MTTSMSGHVRALAVIQIVYASFGLLAGAVIFVIFGGIATIVGFSASPEDSLIAVPVLTLIGGTISSIVVILSLPRLVAGIGLLRCREWGRILTAIVSVLGLADFPLGTALGVYALWVLTHRDTAMVFDEAPGGYSQSQSAST